ncbi:AAA family ATPase [Pseudorhodobacter ferrugineus]|uniref:AAA family ATPase n=1 Tax=Pseudorhodobacter ferrugineus TaxID=77008 RepID=UPI0003B576B8|nr:AAA family ATPase [Pseudorhodobacter ferrugineus]
MTRGFLLGKFMPPHQGHLFMCQTAAALVDHLTVLVCTLPDDPVPGPARAAWMMQLLPHARIIHFDKVVPQAPADHPDFWPIWQNICQTAHPEPLDFVFGSEPYVTRLAACLKTRPVILDADRLAFPTSATAIRTDPAAHWAMIPGPVRAYYQKRIAVVGAESTGKTTLTAALATHFGTVYMPEYGRSYDTMQRHIGWQPHDFQRIATVHTAMRNALAPQAGPLLIEDTDPLQTGIWEQTLLNTDQITTTPLPLADLYLLLDTGLAWQDDGTRYLGDPVAREAFQTRLTAQLTAQNANVIPITDTGPARLKTAIAAITFAFPTLSAPQRSVL